MTKRYCTAICIVFLLNVITALGDEREDSHPGYEYIQIFRNIPTLFEYLLEVLEETPQVLEKNDISVFKRDVNTKSLLEECSNPNVKRHLDIYECRNLLANLAEDNSSEEVFKRNVDQDDPNDTVYTTNRVYSTKTHEYGHSNAEYKSKNKTEDIKQPEEYRFKTESTSGNTKISEQGLKKNQKGNKSAKTYKKRQSLDSNTFYLTPDEVEEQAIRVEKMLEEHNSKGR